MKSDTKPWQPTPDEMSKCAWYGTQRAGPLLFPSGMNTCPLSHAGHCPLAQQGLRPDVGECFSNLERRERSDEPERHFVLLYASNEIIPLAEWEKRVADRL